MCLRLHINEKIYFLKGFKFFNRSQVKRNAQMLFLFLFIRAKILKYLLVEYVMANPCHGSLSIHAFVIYCNEILVKTKKCYKIKNILKEMSFAVFLV